MVIRQDEQTMIHLSEINAVLIETTAAYVSSYLLSELANASIPVLFCGLEHSPIGQYLPLYGAHDSSRRVREQVSWSDSVKGEIWRQIVRSKILNQASVLRACSLPQASMLEEYASDVRFDDETNREGHAAKVYFNALFGTGFSREQENPVNARLNYGYAILLAWLNREITIRGYLTQLGIHHCNDYNSFNLACDFMEPFRPVIDWCVLQDSDAELSPSTKIELVSLFDQHHTFNDGNYRLSSIIGLFAKTNLAILSERQPLTSYLDFTFHAD